MKRRRMTIEELKELNPSMENPVELECENGFFTDDFKKVKVIGPIYKDRVIILDLGDNLNYLSYVSLYHYPSKKPEKKLKRFWLWSYESDLSEALIKGYHYLDEECRDTSGFKRNFFYLM